MHKLMKQNREPRNNPHLYGKFTTKEPRIYNGEKIVSSINGVKKIGQPHATE